MKNRRLVAAKWGGVEVLEVVEDQHLPEPGPGQVRIKTLASGVAFTDVMIRKGKYPDVKQDPPLTLGYDLVGRVEKLGPGVKQLEVGQRVVELTVTGAQADYVCLDAEHLVPVPSEFDPAQAVSLVLSYVTAYQMLTREADVKRGERILVHGAGGAVGTALLQIGKHLGLEIWGTASQAKHDLILQQGAAAIDYRHDDFVAVINKLDPPGVDVVFDHIGGEHFKRSFSVLRSGGCLIAFGFYNDTMGKGGSILLDFLRLKLWNLLPNGRKTSLYSIGPLRKKRPDWFEEDLGSLFDLALKGKIDPVIWKRVDLEEIPRAHRWIENADVQGKIICVFENES